MVQPDWGAIAGYCAAGLVFCAFYMKAMAPLRAVAIASNAAFIAYGILHALYPVLVLHAVLLPLNCLRLWQQRRLIQRVRAASRGEPSVEWLIPLMTRRVLRPGEVLFRRGEPATSLFLVLHGTIRIVEFDVVLGPGAVVGEIGVFAPDSSRTGTAVCETTVEIGAMSDEEMLRLYYQHPAFGMYLTRLVVRRMVAGEQRHEAQRSRTVTSERGGRD